ITDPPVCEKTTAQMVFSLTDELGAVITSGLTTCTLTLYDKLTGTILNSRSAQSINGANGGVIAAGVLTLTLSNLDNVLISQTRANEEHVALIEYTWASGAKFGKKQVTFTVVN